MHNLKFLYLNERCYIEFIFFTIQNFKLVFVRFSMAADQIDPVRIDLVEEEVTLESNESGVVETTKAADCFVAVHIGNNRRIITDWIIDIVRLTIEKI